MEPSFNDLLIRLAGFPAPFLVLRDGVQKAIDIADRDPEMALTRSRKVLEWVIREVYERRINEPPGTRPLENLLQRLVKDGFFPTRLDAYANTVRMLGNVGTHRFGETVGPEDVYRSLTQLLPILDWYVREERPVPAPPKVSAPSYPSTLKILLWGLVPAVVCVLVVSGLLIWNRPHVKGEHNEVPSTPATGPVTSASTGATVTDPKSSDKRIGTEAKGSGGPNQETPKNQGPTSTQEDPSQHSPVGAGQGQVSAHKPATPLVFVIDRSGGPQGEEEIFVSARSAAREFVSSLEESVRLSLLFASKDNRKLSESDLDLAKDRAKALKRIDYLFSDDGDAVICDAVSAAVDHLRSLKPEDPPGIVIVLTPAHGYRGQLQPAQLIDKVKPLPGQRSVVLHVVVYGKSAEQADVSDAVVALRKAAETTGGKFFAADSTNLAEILQPKNFGLAPR
jgi:hypothetical protein